MLTDPLLLDPLLLLLTPPFCAADLQAFPQKGNERALLISSREAEADLPEWPHDVMRHTFASMHYDEHQKESLLKAQMGHSTREDVLSAITAP